MARSSEDVGRPASPVVKPNQPIPAGTRIERQEFGGINSPNPAGGEVSPSRYTK
jgi:hypothetical protein